MVKESGSFDRRNAEFSLESIFREFTSFKILGNWLGKLRVIIEECSLVRTIGFRLTKELFRLLEGWSGRVFALI